jgi:metal-dependent HD superfamily phosphatase/phosphodiesterase
MITLKDIKNNPEVKSFISVAETQMRALGYTEHSFRHVNLVARNAGNISLVGL